MLFQSIVKNIDQHRDDAKWLVKSLDELLGTVAEQEGQLEQQRLEGVLERYRTLMPAIEITTTKSSIVVRCYEYREVVEKSTEWLTEAGQRLREDVTLDDIHAVKVLLEEQQVSVDNIL